MTTTTRRAAIGSIAAASGAFLAHPAAMAADVVELSALIEPHRDARKAFHLAIDELEAAEPDKNAEVIGIGGGRYMLRNGKDRVARCIRDHFNSLAQLAKTLAASSATVGAEALAILERERDAALVRLEAAYAAWDAANDRWNDTNAAEVDALIAVCAHRCVTPGDSVVKFRYLLGYKDHFTDEQTDAIFESLIQNSTPPP